MRVDRTAFSVVNLDQADDDVSYWLTRPPAERLRALELLRQTLYGYDPATARLQRVLEIAELQGS
jgi:hypothetical protein